MAESGHLIDSLVKSGAIEAASACFYFAQTGEQPAVKTGIATEPNQRIACIQAYQQREVHLLGAIVMHREHGDNSAIASNSRPGREKERQIRQFKAGSRKEAWYASLPNWRSPWR